MADWNLLSRHGLALVAIAREPESRLRDIAEQLGVTERTAHRVVSDLVEAGYVSRAREGRRSVYRVHPHLPMRHPSVRSLQVGEALAALLESERADTSG